VSYVIERCLYHDEGPLMTRGELDSFHVSELSVGGFILTDSVYPPGFVLPRHFHHSYCIYVVLEGSLTETGVRDRISKPLDVVLNPAGRTHAVSFHNAGGRCFLVEIPTKWADRIHEYSPLLTEDMDLTGEAASSLMTRLYRESHFLDSVSPLVVEGILLEIIATASRRLKPSTEQRRPKWLSNVVEMIGANFSEGLTLGTLAAEGGVHPVYLATTFRKHYGHSIGEHVRRLRIDFVCTALATSDAPITDIAQRAGFADHSHLCKNFKRVAGQTPAQYRALFRRS
jgi:AraC family transcriptional regulator